MSELWPDGARGALGLSFDNLGEAAEIGAGALARDAPQVGSHPTATEIVPRLLDRLDAVGLQATFFVEGLNVELYPELLREIDARGHEVAYHSWTHEQWSKLEREEQSLNLDTGVVAMAQLGLNPLGFRPPGGSLGEGGVEMQRELHLYYASPAGEGAGVQDGVALLPFAWRNVDATCVLPQLGDVRRQMTGSADPIAPDSFLAFLEAEIATLAERGGFICTVLHPFMLEWFGDERLAALLGRVAEAAASGDVWVAPFCDIAPRVLLRREELEGATTLDPTSW
jgi:peptidoglycan/xylan/chitin deacetylase (PgdA/CDA1 family)